MLHRLRQDGESMKTQTALAIWILLASASLTQAQTTGIWMGVGPAPRSGVVANAPVSADLVTINDRTDSQPGLKTEFHGKVARNSQGSSYFAMEHMLPNSEGPLPMHVTITSPVANTVTTLDPQQKTAFIGHVPASAASSASSALLTPAAAASSGRPVPATMTAPAISTANSKTEQLGTKTMDGLEVVGVRTTRTTQAGGSDVTAFVSTTDTWTSPELKMVVQMENTTSNGDHHVTKLTNITRTEPSATLFQVPAGYTVRENAPMASNVH